MQAAPHFTAVLWILLSMTITQWVMQPLTLEYTTHWQRPAPSEPQSGPPTYTHITVLRRLSLLHQDKCVNIMKPLATTITSPKPPPIHRSSWHWVSSHCLAGPAHTPHTPSTAAVTQTHRPAATAMAPENNSHNRNLPLLLLVKHQKPIPCAAQQHTPADRPSASP